MEEWPAQSFNVCCSSERVAWKHLNAIGAGLPSRYNFGGRESTWEDI